MQQKTGLALAHTTILCSISYKRGRVCRLRSSARIRTTSTNSTPYHGYFQRHFLREAITKTKLRAARSVWVAEHHQRRSLQLGGHHDARMRFGKPLFVVWLFITHKPPETTSDATLEPQQLDMKFNFKDVRLEQDIVRPQAEKSEKQVEERRIMLESMRSRLEVLRCWKTI